MRPLRIRLPNAWHHVINRGLNRMTIYLDDRDREHRLELLAELPDRFGVIIHAFALMDTHDHFLLQVPRNNLDAAMQWFNMSYGVWFNKRHQRLGKVFSSPYKAILVEEDGSWALDLSRYIHLNPIRTAALGLDKTTRAQEKRGGVPPPSPELISRRLKTLREYRWSSYPVFAGYRSVPEWLCTAELWRRVSGNRKDGADSYRKWIEDHVRQHVAEVEEEEIPKTLVAGSPGFRESMRPLLQGDRREQPELRQWDQAIPFETIVTAVESAKGESWDAFRERHGDGGRDLVFHLARRHSGLTLRQIGEKGGGLHYVAVSNALRRFEKRLESDRLLQRLKKSAEAQLLNV
jgi:putative transposase